MADTRPKLAGTPSRATSRKQGEDAGSLRGTMVAVLVLGGLIVASWLGVFSLFLSRN